MPGLIPSEEEVLGYFDSCSNWGRWGPDDELGTLNHLTPAHRRTASALVRDGVSVSCARRIPTRQLDADFTNPPLHLMTSSGEAWVGKPTPPNVAQTSGDFIGLAFHGLVVTHVDSLCHVFRDGHMYNGHPADRVGTASGATAQSIEVAHDGMIGRGVLLDIARAMGVRWLEPGQPVFPEDLESAERAEGVEVGPGDFLLCRFGTMALRNEEGPSRTVFERRPGLHAACLPWLHERQVAMLGSDSAQDALPSGYDRIRIPIHEVGIVAMGLWLIDNCDLEAIGDTAARIGRWEFLLSIGPLRIQNGTGSPVNPIALF
jgi:kynurenine formamidase